MRPRRPASISAFVITATAALAALLFAATANAAIRIAGSRYDNGTLIVSGMARPNQPVTLDGKYKTTSDSGGRFEFRVDS
jgi:hypothetical protein